MKSKKQNQVAVEESEQSSQHDSGVDEATNGHHATSTNGKNVQLTESDKKNGNLKNFNISKKTIKKLKARNVEFLYPVQVGSYTSIYEQKDCLIQASNGTGKTLAFAIPIVELLQGDNAVELVSGRAPRVIVLVPSRDINKKISDDLETIVNDLTVVSVFNGKKKKAGEQEAAILNGCDIVVGTPDRLKEFIDNEKLDFSQVKHVVLDEVDQMVDVDDVKKILKHIVKSDEETKAQLIVFSATLSDSVRKLTKKYLTEDFVTLNLVKEKAEETIADDEDDEESFDATSTNKSAAKDDVVRSLLTKQENYTTYKLTVNDGLKGVGLVFTMLRKCLGDDFDAKGACAQISFTKDYKNAIFDLSSDNDEQIATYWKDSPRIQMGPITVLPVLDDESTWTGDDKSFSRGGNNSSRGGGGGGGGGGSGCFNCGKEGHRSFECTEPKKAGGRSSGGGGGGGNACFNCGQEGHRSYECTEPKKAGGRSGGGGGGGGGGNACFNCGQEGHRSYECTEPKKAGGRSGGGGGGGGGNACFNCGQEGHRSYECTEPKKAGGRPSGGGGGGERSNACFNCGKDGHRSYECTEPKKAGGRPGGGGGNACFNCGQEGHRSFECSEPKKDRPSFGSGGRGGGRGGARGGGPKRSFNDNYNNGHSAGEATNKKIKFDDDE